VAGRSLVSWLSRLSADFPQPPFSLTSTTHYGGGCGQLAQWAVEMKSAFLIDADEEVREHTVPFDSSTHQ
jgi:hypothetical protein